MSELHERLAAGGTILIDGATGTELERRGVSMIEGGWCGLAALSDPDIVEQVHEANLVAGAEVIIANTFATSRHVLDHAGHGEHFEALNRRGIELARSARDRIGGVAGDGHPAVVAGSVSTELLGAQRPPLDVCQANFADQVRIQAEAGAELFILEMMRDLDQTRLILDAVRSTGLPAWVGYSCELHDGQPWLSDHEVRLTEALDDVRALDGRPVEAVMIMHTEVEDIDACLDVIDGRWSGPVGVYAHTGRFEAPHWIFADTISPEGYATAAARWLARGVQIIGGCCGIGPEHIQLLRDTTLAVAEDR